MIEEQSWEQFRLTGLLWFINTILHMFGWAIAIELDLVDKTHILRAYPARVKFRGFSEDINSEGYIKVSEYLKENIGTLLEEVKE